MTARVAVVEDAVGPWSKGGRETRYAALLPRLAKRGFAVEVFTMRWWSEEPVGEVRYHAISPLVPMYKGDRRSIAHAIRFAFSTFRLLRYRFDVILADQIPIVHLIPLRLVAWIKRVPLVVQWHEVWGDEYWRQYLGRAGAAAAVLERATARLADEIVAVSEEIEGRLEALGVAPDRICVVANALDRARLDAVPAADPGAELIAVGRLIPHKRVDEAIRITGLLRDRGRSVHLSVIGEGPDRDRLDRLARELGLAGLVSLEGTLDADDDVWRQLRAARVLVSASDREGFGLVVAESLALGTPVVCADHPHNDAARLVEDGRTGSIVPPGDLEAMTSAVERWLDCDGIRSEIAQRFWETHPDLEWDAAADALAACLTPLAGE